ncbi:isoamylase early set domain-containing protein [Anaeromyxobacter dehalogenans]|uniref:Glycoside hydrolase, family 13-like protein n=1 Tax=Anaeromyxobacter dehalogenans (strain 2CP-C) TaxID=290397 RepID=Q2IFZ5_ANADE|nr:isoamylase early set domain-containing protein [Anaeromyxobacter dehalogenans]ABC83502.1 glycoside hydrolase, family 13-like protein [Anaeromyxobacter dehalogenans 2CP-C]
MTERELQDLLDGRPGPLAAERLLSSLPPEERQAALRLVALSRLAGAGARPAPSDDFVQRTMARVRASRPPRRRPLLAWLTGPRLSPLGALGGAAAAAFLAVAVARFPAPPGPEAARAPEAPVVLARLALAAPGARVVRVAGDFNGWKPEVTPLRRGPDGVWTVEVPLRPGRRYEYMFVVDGSWTTDPGARALADDGFGGKNAILDL